MTEQTTPAQFHAAIGVDDWRVLYHVVATQYRTNSLARGAELAAAIALAAGDDDRYVTIDVRWAAVVVRLFTRDIELARRIAAAASELAIEAEPHAVQLLSVSIDALVSADVLPFWQAVLGYRPNGDDYLYDPSMRGPNVEFQHMDSPRPQRNRIHIDIAVPHDRAEARVAEALAAGGRLVTNEHAPKWWVLADAEGNEACIATWVGRE